MKPEIVEAYRCPQTKKVFTDKKTWEKHVAKLEEARIEKENLKNKDKEIKEAMRTATSLEQLFERMSDLAKKYHTLKSYQGKKVTDIEFQLVSNDCHISIRTMKDYNNKDVKYLNISRYRFCASSEYSGFGSDVEYLFPGFRSGSGGYHGKEWTNRAGKTYTTGYVCSYDCRFEITAIPGIMKSVQRYLQLEKEQDAWDKKCRAAATEATHAAELFDSSLKDALNTKQEYYNDLNDKIVALQEEQRKIGSELNRLIDKRQAEYEKTVDQFKSRDPFKHEKEMKEIYQTGRVADIVKSIKDKKDLEDLPF